MTTKKEIFTKYPETGKFLAFTSVQWQQDFDNDRDETLTISKEGFFLLSSLNTKTEEYHSPPNHLVKTQRYIFSLILNRSSIFKARKLKLI